MGSGAHLHNKRNRTGTPQVGIIFVVEGNIWIDAIPLTEAADYGEFKIHERGHDKYWDQLLGMAMVAGSEYDEHPRGRVVYNTKQRQYTLYLDRCILRDRDLVKRIMAKMNLPLKATRTATDGHYRCPACLHRAEDESRF